MFKADNLKFLSLKFDQNLFHSWYTYFFVFAYFSVYIYKQKIHVLKNTNNNKAYYG